MNQTTVARLHPDGGLAELPESGIECPMIGQPMRAMTEAEIVAAAARDPDARSMTAEEMSAARRVPRARTMRRALGMTLDDFAARYLDPFSNIDPHKRKCGFQH